LNAIETVISARHSAISIAHHHTLFRSCTISVVR